MDQAATTDGRDSSDTDRTGTPPERGTTSETSYPRLTPEQKARVLNELQRAYEAGALDV